MFRQLVRLVATIFIFFLSTGTAVASYYTTKVIPDSYRNLGTPEDIITLPDGTMWYADSGNSRIVKINSTGEILRTVGRSGANDGEFALTVKSITRDNNGYLYVLDYCSVYKLDFNGGFLKSWGSCGVGAGELSDAKGIHFSTHGNMLLVSDSVNNRIVKYDTDGNVLGGFGSLGTGDGEFNQPHGLTTDSSGNIFVVDTNNHRVQVFQENGTFIRSFGNNTISDPAWLEFPKDAEVLSNGDVLVTSQNSYVIKKFDSAGSVITSWGSQGTGNIQFHAPQYLTQATDGTIWVTDFSLKRLQHFTNSGVFVEVIQNNGQTAGLFTTPYSFDFDSSGNIFVLDDTRRVQKFDPSGNYLSTPILAGVITDGSAYHIAIAPTSQNILVSTEVNVWVFDSTGTFINTLGAHGVWADPPADGTGDGEFNHARGMDFDSTGLLYVVDYFNARVQKFDLAGIADPGGGYLAQWPVMTNPENIFIDANDHIFISPTEYNGVSLDVRQYDTSGAGGTVYLDKFNNGVFGADLYGSISGLYFVGDAGTGVGQFFISDRVQNNVYVYDMPGAVLSERIGSTGSDLTQFDGPNYAKINTTTNDLVVADSFNHRVQLLTAGVKIQNLITSTDVINTANSLSLVTRSVDPGAPESNSLSAELFFGDYIVSDFTVNLTENRDWVNVNAIILPDQSKSLIVKLNPTDAPGVSATHSLYIAKRQGQTSVVICPSALQIADISLACTGGYTLNQGDAGLTVVTVGSQEYWKVSGLTGTGGLSPVSNSYTLDPSATTVPVGDAISLLVTVTSDAGITDTTYTGTAHLSTSPGTSTLPTDYAFSGADAGVHTFNSITFSQAGTYTLTVTDTVDSLRTQSVTITVTSAGGGSDTGSGSTASTDTGSSGSGTDNSAPSCTNAKPTYIPDLFQINVNGSSAKLFFTPNPSINRFYVSYSTNRWAEEHGLEVILGRGGVQALTVSALKPRTTYYFRVRGQNGCMPGDWSKIMKITTRSKGVIKAVPFYKEVLVKSTPSTSTYRSFSGSSPAPVIYQNRTYPTMTPPAIFTTSPTPVVTSVTPYTPPETRITASPASKKICFLWWCF